MEVLFDKRSQYQEITLESWGDRVVLYLDGYFQFDSLHERSYHEFIALLPLSMSREARNVLILGGGDGLAARDALRHPVERVVLVEIDPMVLEVANAEPIVSINDGSLKDPRVSVIVGDALEWVKRLPPKAFDVIVADFPAATSEELKRLYSPEFYSDVFKLLAPGGVFVTQVSEDRETRDELRKLMEAMLGYGLTVVGVPSVTFTEAFVFGSDSPFRIRRPAPSGTVIPALIEKFDLLLRAGKKVIVHVPNKRRAKARVSL